MDKYSILPASIFSQPANIVARELLGRYLIRTISGKELVLRVIETEAYLGTCDKASHAYQGKLSKRNKSLYLPGGYFYVYFIYGMYHCLNVVTGPVTNGEAVLIRAGDPITGGDTMAKNRNLHNPAKPGQIAGGPGKLCQALNIDLSFNALKIKGQSALYFTTGEKVQDSQVAKGSRIGVAYAQEAANWQLRFAISQHREMSKPII